MPDPSPVPIPPPETSVLPGTNSSETDISKAEAQPKANLSEFSLLLTSIITLYVGEDRIKYYAHEGTLCKLQFFRAALQGQFKEALEKSISMPEDDPEAVSALIEWLYTGKYTFNGNRLHKTTMELRAAPETPSKPLLQGLFHLEVCIVASKYNCDIFQVAIEEFFKVQNGMDDIDILRLYKAKFTVGGLVFPFLELKLTDPLVLYCGRVRKWVHRLYKEHSEEMHKTALEFPQLASDLLRISVIDSSG